MMTYEEFSKTLMEIAEEERVYRQEMRRWLQRPAWLREVAKLACAGEELYSQPRSMAAQHMTKAGPVRLLTYKHKANHWKLLMETHTVKIRREARLLESVTDEALGAFTAIEADHLCGQGCRTLNDREVHEMRSAAQFYEDRTSARRKTPSGLKKGRIRDENRTQ